MPSGYSVTEGLDASIAAGGFDTFTVELATGTRRPRSPARSASTTNDADENPFNFAITGRVFSEPEITVLGNSER